MGNTDNLNLETHDLGIDTNRGFESYRMGLNGSGSICDYPDSNMMLISDWAGTLPIAMLALLSVTSASVATVNTYATSASSSASSLLAGINAVDSRFEIIDEFSGSGQADFDSISQDYTHVIIIGTAGVNRGVDLADVGCDFNGDSGSSNYATVEWIRSGSAGGSGGSSVDFASSSTAQILLGNVSGSVNSGYGGTFFAIVPYYSGSTGFYKTAMGFSMNHMSDWMSSMKTGGYWQSVDPITRIRIFGSDNTATRYNFLTGTKITLYGLL